MLHTSGRISHHHEGTVARLRSSVTDTTRDGIEPSGAIPLGGRRKEQTMDPRIERLAEILIDHSVELGEGDHLLIETTDVPDEIVVALIREARRAGGHPHVTLRHSRVHRALVEEAADDALETWKRVDLERMKAMDAYVAIRGSDNVSEMAGVRRDRMKAFQSLYVQPVHLDERVNRTRWCVLRWPTPSMAQLAETGTEEFESFYFDVCTLDYARMCEAAGALKERMEATDVVRLKGPGETDLTFSIREIPAVPCCGKRNIPDGECFTAPVRDSARGVIEFNTPTIYQGESFRDVRLELEDGRIVDWSAGAGDPDALDAVFTADEGARFIGEFSIAFNPHIRHAMKDILFDEKIAGSIHFTPGNAYEEADNGNRSEIHWDLVLIQRPEHGGGTVDLDGEVVRREGRFVVPDLEGLNPENLTG